MPSRCPHCNGKGKVDVLERKACTACKGGRVPRSRWARPLFRQFPNAPQFSEPCSKCKGTSWIPQTSASKCPNCSGSGELAHAASTAPPPKTVSGAGAVVVIVIVLAIAAGVMVHKNRQPPQGPLSLGINTGNRAPPHLSPILASWSAGGLRLEWRNGACFFNNLPARTGPAGPDFVECINPVTGQIWRVHRNGSSTILNTFGHWQSGPTGVWLPR